MATEDDSQQAQLTTHALKRAAQRGVRRTTLDAVIAYADRSVPVGDGCVSLFISQQELDRVPISPAERERVSGVVIIFDEAANVVVSVLKPSGPNSRRYYHYLRTRKFERRPGTASSDLQAKLYA